MQANYFLIDSRCDPLPMRLWERKEHFCIWNLKSANYLSPFWKRLLFPPTFITVEVYRNSVKKKKSPRNRWAASVGGPKRTPPPPTMFLNPRPAGVWLVTRPAGGGGPKGPPLRSPKLLDRFPKFKRHSIALYVNYPYKVKHLTRMSLMTSQVRSKSEFGLFGLGDIGE